MEQIILAFITGLTTGGLSCLAVQGGLLANSLAHQIEHDLSQSPQPGTQAGKGTVRRFQQSATRSAPVVSAALNPAAPIALFLLAKIVAYTLLGGLLGLVGSFLTLSPLARAILLIAIGVFMLGNGLRMLNVHPITRYFNLEPPKFITRFIRRLAKKTGQDQPVDAINQPTDLIAPLFLGALTVLIPCGVTQAMMATALGTGNPAQGAALMFAFTLGTSPVFFIIAYLATRLGARLEKYFLRFVAVVVLVLGLLSLNNGLNLIGSPLSLNNLTRGLFPAVESSTNLSPGSSTEAGVLQLKVANNGYFPALLHAKSNQSLSLQLVTDKTFSCARDFVIPVLKYYRLLPATGRISVTIPPQKPGTIMRFTCSMGMYTGQIVFDN